MAVSIPRGWGFLDKRNDRGFRAQVEREYDGLKEGRRSTVHMGFELEMASDGNVHTVDEENTRLTSDQVR